MLELPRGLWRWLTECARDFARIAAAAEAIAEELSRIRKTLEDDNRKEDQ